MGTDTELVLPVSSRGSTRPRRAAVRLLSAGALFLLLAYLLTPRAPSVPEDAHVSAYWDAVSSRNFERVLADKYDARITALPHCKHDNKITPARAEQIYLSVPSNDSAAAASLRYTSHAHSAGTGWDFVTALQVKNDWERALGVPVTAYDEAVYDAGEARAQARIKHGMGRLSVWVDTYYPVMNSPVYGAVTLLSDPPVKAKLREAHLKGDPDSELADEVRAFHGFSVSGDVTAKYVYVGYGRKADFDLLARNGVDLNGTIAVVKYGRVFRGLKVKAAQEAGAVGCIIYTDPGDDGDVTEANGYKQYPDGPARVPSSVQRGSVQFLSKYPGDPTTPGEPAYRNASRVEGTNIPSIPSLPLSYEDAIPILKALKGHGLSAADLDPSFDGGLGPYGVEYFTGPSTVDIHLVNEVNTRVMPIWNTMAVIPGYIQDEVVVIGNHRDAWSLGASDPNSGTASQYELARGLGKLLRKGWRPLRSVVLASWDGEEYGLVGSTEWAEDFGAWLQANAAAYLNLDASTSGSNFGAAASPSLARLVRGAAADVAKGANPSRSVWDARNDGGDWTSYWAAKGDPEAVAELEHEQTRQLVAGSSDTGIAPLGSGSDYTAFLMRYGVASTDFSYGGGPRDKAVYMYHSVYDSHTWMKTYGDPGFHKHAEGAQLIGLLALRIADALILPFNTTQYAHDLGTYLGTLRALRDGNADFKELDLDGLASAIRELQSASAKLDDKRTLLLRELHDVLRSRSLAGAWWRIRSTYSRIWAAVTSGTNQRPLLQWDATAEDVAAALAARPKLPPHKRRELKRILGEIRTVNRKLQAFESGLISEDGIHEREWYKHKGTAPGKWLGYGATTFPGVTEALTFDNSVAQAQKETRDLDVMIRGMAKRLQA